MLADRHQLAGYFSPEWGVCATDTDLDPQQTLPDMVAPIAALHILIGLPFNARRAFASVGEKLFYGQSCQVE